MLIHYKIIAAVTIWLLTLTCSLFPISTHRQQRFPKFFLLSDYFARGIFLGVGFLHLLPEAVAHLQGNASHILRSCWLSILLAIFFFLLTQLKFNKGRLTNILNVSYFVAIIALIMKSSPLAGGMMAATILTLWLLEHLLPFFTIDQQSTPMASLLFVLLSGHALLAGSALGLSHHLAGFLIILIAILAHKGAESFALGMQFHRLNLPIRQSRWLLLVFSLVTPLGIAIGSGLGDGLQFERFDLFSGVVDAITAATLIYLANENCLFGVNEQFYNRKLTSLLCFISGILLMGFVATFI